jgi:DNA-binding response OmpR family regulator
MYHILIIEDDPAIQKGLQAGLEEEHYTIVTASDGMEGYRQAQDDRIDLILLDLMLPGKNGQEICRDLRHEGITTPILMLTSKNEEIDKVLGFEIGADDYVTKPFSMRELKVRVKALLRRAGDYQKEEAEIYSFADVRLDFKKQEAYNNDIPLIFSTKEFEILRYFINHVNEVVSRDQLLDEVWGYDIFPTTRTVDNYILNIRKKIETNPADPIHLVTVPKAGYKFIP